MSSTYTEDSSLLDKLDTVVPAPLAQFDAFPKIPTTYKARSESRGFMTILIGLMALLLMLNDIGEYIWGWPDYEFSVDNTKSSFLNINLDLVVNMPCNFLSVDLRDAVGDRLFLSGSLRRDGTKFDVGQATALKEHAAALSARQVLSQSRKSAGFFATLLRRNKSLYKPTYNHEASATACRIWGSLQVKRVTANLHITTLGHGYASYQHVDHNQMNLSHIITEFSFGPHFPDITQPLDDSFETTDEHFIAYQYFLHVVPTTYIAPRSAPLETHQYSVTHYTRVLEHNQGTPGIFFKFDLDPLSITLHQRTTTLIQLIIRCVGVMGGVFVCMGYAIRITTRAVEVVSGADQTAGIVAAEASGAKVGLRSKWGGGELRARPKSGRMVPQGNGWVMEGTPSPYSSYTNSPILGQMSPNLPGQTSPYIGGSPHSSAPSTPNLNAIGLGFPSNSFGPSGGATYVSAGYGVSPPGSVRSHSRESSRSGSGLGPPRSAGARTPGIDIPPSATTGVPAPVPPGAPVYNVFPPTPVTSEMNINSNGHGDTLQGPPLKKSDPKKDD